MLNSCQAGVDAAKLSDEKKISVMKDVNAMVLELEGLLNRTNSTERFVRRGGGERGCFRIFFKIVSPPLSLKLPKF